MTSTGPRVPSSRYEEAVDDYGDGAFAPFQAELFFGMNLSSPSLGADALSARRSCGPSTATPSSTPSTPTWPTRCPRSCPPGSSATTPTAAPRAPTTPRPRRRSSRFAFPDGKVPTINIDFDESDAQQEMAELVAADLDAVGIPTKLRPLPLEDYKQFVVSGDQELFSFGWIGAYGSPDAYLAPLFGSAANDNLTNYRSARVDGLLDRARARRRPGQEPAALGRRGDRVLEAAVVVPIAQFRTQVVVADRVEGLAHAVDGTVDWTLVQPHRLTRIGWPRPRGGRVR